MTSALMRREALQTSACLATLYFISNQLNRGVWCELLAFIPLYKCVLPVACKSLPPGSTLSLSSPRCDNWCPVHRWGSPHGHQPGVCSSNHLGIIPALSPDNTSLGHHLTYSAVIIRNNLAAHTTAISRVPTAQSLLVFLISYHDPIVLGL